MTWSRRTFESGKCCFHFTSAADGLRRRYDGQSVVNQLMKSPFVIGTVFPTPFSVLQHVQWKNLMSNYNFQIIRPGSSCLNLWQSAEIELLHLATLSSWIGAPENRRWDIWDWSDIINLRLHNMKSWNSLQTKSSLQKSPKWDKKVLGSFDSIRSKRCFNVVDVLPPDSTSATCEAWFKKAVREAVCVAHSCVFLRRCSC